jgi:hypothetical protein
MEGVVLPNPRVKEALKNYVELWLHYDDKEKGEANIALQTRLIGHLGNPLWAIVDPADEHVLRTQVFTLSVDDFVRFLQAK